MVLQMINQASKNFEKSLGIILEQSFYLARLRIELTSFAKFLERLVMQISARQYLFQYLNYNMRFKIKR